jgi:cellulose synthase/poly-beta-1,6-N-acetylglucosamine synthase-like glycosyltransferase
MKKITVGIPAYNEEHNILNVLKGIYSQKQTSWELLEVIVLCDGCTDNTAKKARNFSKNKLKVIDDKLRIGKTQRLNQLFKMATGEIIVMFDADIRFSDKEVINNLIQPLIGENEVLLVGGNSKPFNPKNFVQKAVYSTFKVFYQSRLNIKNGHNIFGATGSILAIKKQLAKEIVMPKIVNEDAYIYLTCLKKGFKFKYVDNAVIYYKLPTNFPDYIKQLFRSNPEAVEAELYKYFGNLVYSEFKRPFKFYVFYVLKELVRNPFGVLSIIIINLICRPLHNIVIKHYKLSWFTSPSTKL